MWRQKRLYIQFGSCYIKLSRKKLDIFPTIISGWHRAYVTQVGKQWLIYFPRVSWKPQDLNHPYINFYPKASCIRRHWLDGSLPFYHPWIVCRCYTKYHFIGRQKMTKRKIPHSFVTKRAICPHLRSVLCIILMVKYGQLPMLLKPCWVLRSVR